MIYTSVFLGLLAASDALNVAALRTPSGLSRAKLSMQVAAEAEVAQPVALAKVRKGEGERARVPEAAASALPWLSTPFLREGEGRKRKKLTGPVRSHPPVHRRRALSPWLAGGGRVRSPAQTPLCLPSLSLLPRSLPAPHSLAAPACAYFRRLPISGRR
eukprot:scaffold77655_cov27-Tisochrysis_lutea.AAC.2